MLRFRCYKHHSRVLTKRILNVPLNFKKKIMDSKYILQSLNDTISSRKGGDPESSYVAYLFAKGQDEMLKKIIEEAGEVVLASKDDDKIKVVKEIADLWFHTLVLMAQHEIHPEDVLGELERRQGVSGIAEKRMRGSIFKE